LQAELSWARRTPSGRTGSDEETARWLSAWSTDPAALHPAAEQSAEWAGMIVIELDRVVTARCTSRREWMDSDGYAILAEESWPRLRQQASSQHRARTSC
jgi:hypothetical protein